MGEAQKRKYFTLAPNNWRKNVSDKIFVMKIFNSWNWHYRSPFCIQCILINFFGVCLKLSTIFLCVCIPHIQSSIESKSSSFVQNFFHRVRSFTLSESAINFIALIMKALIILEIISIRRPLSKNCWCRGKKVKKKIYGRKLSVNLS